MPLPMPGNDLIIALGVVLSAFVSEDGAIFAAATLASTKVLGASSAVLSAFLGLWISDFGVYAAVRVAREKLPEHSRAAKWLTEKLVPTKQSIPDSNRHLTLALSRFLPGTRFPAYVAAGLFRMPVNVFAGITAVSAALWTLLIFIVVHLLPIQAGSVGAAITLAGSVGFGIFVLLTAWRIFGSKVLIAIRKMRRWEFWPAWIFYPPVALMCGWLAIRFRGLSLPTISNPSQRNGGIVGESKIEILRDLMRTSPEFAADAYLLEPGPLTHRLETLEHLCSMRAVDFPFVLKPDSAQRGAGFRKINSWQEAGAYLAQVKSPVVLQKYVEEPEEAGIFYYRFPDEEQGHIFSITKKVFPYVTGDGHRTLEELIQADPRASLIAQTYLKRFGSRAGQIVPAGKKVRLVEAGNHCQGCIFRDGEYLATEPLRATIDCIAKEINGFFIGRFDVRYTNDEELQNGTGFRIIELNGAASEATNIYDERNSLWSAYKTLYQQWKLVYSIGAENRRRGFRTASAFDVLKDWKQFRAQAAFYPLAD